MEALQHMFPHCTELRKSPTLFDMHCWVTAARGRVGLHWVQSSFERARKRPLSQRLITKERINSSEQRKNRDRRALQSCSAAGFDSVAFLSGIKFGAQTLHVCL